MRALLESVGLVARAYELPHDLLRDYQPEVAGCILLDLNLPEMTGLELLARLDQRGRTQPFLIVTGNDSAQSAVRAMKAGACDYILKPFNDEALLRGVHSAIALDARHRQTRQRHHQVLKACQTLTQREAQVMRLICTGCSNKQTAMQLGISVKTLEAHRAQVMRKMNAQSLADLVRMQIVASHPPEQSHELVAALLQ